VSISAAELYRSLTADQRNTFIASFLGWTLDAFDFFLVTFVVVRISEEFHESIPTVAFAITITLMLRPLGALIFGLLADRYGRRGPLMIDIAFYSVIELITAFAPDFTAFIILRAIYGVAMGGEWGVGAALAMEALPTRTRGLFSGILQEGYATGFLLAAVAYYLVYPHLGWRGMFVVGALPALLIFFIRARVPESPAWQRGHARGMGATGADLWQSIITHWPLFIYAILLICRG
jgi:MFS transporter, SHS family, lactate transporter